MAHYFLRPIGGSWEGDPQHPTAATNKPLLIIDEQYDDPQHLRLHEAEQLRGMAPGTTAGDNITPLMQPKCIGAGWDINVTSLLLSFLLPHSLDDFAQIHLATLTAGHSDDQLAQGSQLILFLLSLLY